MKKIIISTKLLIIINFFLIIIFYYITSIPLSIPKSNNVDYYSDKYEIIRENLEEKLTLHSSVLYNDPEAYNKLEYLGRSIDSLYRVKEDRKNLMTKEQLTYYYSLLTDTENLFLKYYGSISQIAKYNKTNYQDKSDIYKAKLVFLKERILSRRKYLL